MAVIDPVDSEVREGGSVDDPSTRQAARDPVDCAGAAMEKLHTAHPDLSLEALSGGPSRTHPLAILYSKG